MSESEIKSEIRQLIEAESDLSVLETVKAMLTQANESESILEKKLISRALKAKENVEKNQVYTREEVDNRLTYLFKD
ncbi:MAG: hypothetical protein Roseis2KO_00370 [Roseivirga sp.]